MNPILLITYNNLELTKQAVASALAQSIPVHLTLVDNGSTDGTREWAIEELMPLGNVDLYTNTYNRPVTEVSNYYLEDLFSSHDYVLGIPNDVILHPDLYREFLKWPRGIVTGSEIRNRAIYDTFIENGIPDTAAISENTPMAVALVRKWCYDALIAKDGHFFDPQFIHYTSDCDFALRMASCGIHGVQLNIPYWHYGSASVRLADPFTMERIRGVADADRARFVQKWGFKVDSLEYGQRPTDPNFRGEHA